MIDFARVIRRLQRTRATRCYTSTVGEGGDSLLAAHARNASVRQSVQNGYNIHQGTRVHSRRLTELLIFQRFASPAEGGGGGGDVNLRGEGVGCQSRHLCVLGSCLFRVAWRGEIRRGFE